MENRIHAPELPDNLEWFNTAAPLRLADHRGKVVLLDFWTYCCINCMHILPDLAYLEQKYPDGLTVIGLHSPKFPNERVGKQLQKAINRYNIRHPVANDPQFTVWQSYGIRAWPSIVFIDPAGYVVGILSGEGRREQLDTLIAEYLATAEQEGLRVRRQVPLQLLPEPTGVLKFPGKVHATAERLYISDSGHHRVLVSDWAGTIQHIYGSGEPGLKDGFYEKAQFNDPQGLVAVGDTLYVADTLNHAVRSINLTSGHVTTVAGTGEQGRYTGNHFEKPLQAPLNSPWDLAHHRGVLYIAMAGQHQIWSMDLATQVIGVYAGSGREDIIDGTARYSAFAQPSGLTLDDNERLYVADSETSAIRSIRLAHVAVSTLVGRGLFEFGDRDGVGKQARLQHVLGVAWDGRRQGLWIADTYNSKLKWLDIRDDRVTYKPLACQLDEPGGLSLSGHTLWIANTNAHQILRYDIEQHQCTPLKLSESRLKD